MPDIKNFKHGGVGALVILHEQYIKSFIETWKTAKQNSINLPETDDQYYVSLDTLLYHVLRSAGNYMRWICENLKLPDPQIRTVPKVENVERELPEYLHHLLEKWKTPLLNVEESEVYSKIYPIHWCAGFTIDSMLEHAVMHPLRHEFQLKKLITEQCK